MMTQAHYQQQPPADTLPVRGYDTTCQSLLPQSNLFLNDYPSFSDQSSPTLTAEQPPATFEPKPDQRAPSPDIALASNHSKRQQPSTIDPS